MVRATVDTMATNDSCHGDGNAVEATGEEVAKWSACRSNTSSVLRVTLDDPAAVLPSKAHASDAGLDITIISIFKTLPNGVVLYNTGLRLAPEPGYYTDLVARSSLMKTGHMLANGVGIIDCDYRGPLLVALWKFDPDAPALTLPARVAQLIPRQVVNVVVQQVDDVTETVRGAGGFGSSGTGATKAL